MKNNPQCDELFGTTQTRANGYDPVQVIQQVYTSGGGTVDRASVGVSFLPLSIGSFSLAEAITYPTQSGFGIGMTAGARVVIDSTANSLWNLSGQAGVNNTLVQAALLLHELGHVYGFLYGSGGSQIKFDGGFGDQSQINQGLVVSKCF